MQLRASRKALLTAEVLVHAAPLYPEPLSSIIGSDTDLLHWFKRVPLCVKCSLFNKNPKLLLLPVDTA